MFRNELEYHLHQQKIINNLRNFKSNNVLTFSDESCNEQDNLFYLNDKSYLIKEKLNIINFMLDEYLYETNDEFKKDVRSYPWEKSKIFSREFTEEDIAYTNIKNKKIKSKQFKLPNLTKRGSYLDEETELENSEEEITFKFYKNFKENVINSINKYEIHFNNNNFGKNKISKSNALNSILLKILVDDTIKISDVISLTFADRLAVIIFLIKKNGFKVKLITNLKNICLDNIKFMKMLTKAVENSRLNNSFCFGITETILNRIMRVLFNDWLKKQEINNKFNPVEVNKLFWNDLYNKANKYEIEAEGYKNFESIFEVLSSKIQMKKKKNKIFKYGPNSKPKYLNIFVNSITKAIILTLCKNNKAFKENLSKYKSEIYSLMQDTNFSCRLVKNNIKSQIAKFIEKSSNWLKNKKNQDIVRVEKVKKDYKTCLIPHFIFDYEKVFDELN